MVALSQLPDVAALDQPVDDTGGLCRAIAARQFSLWPFGTRTLRLFLLVDPSRMDPEVQRGLLRAMQATCFGADTASVTSTVRATALAAHYVLQAHNRAALPHTRVTAAVAVAIVRADVAYVALVGEAAAFIWHGGHLWGQRNGIRQGRPVGLEIEPRVTLWSTRVEPGDRLVLTCGVAWRAGTTDAVREVLSTHPTDVAQRQLTQLLRSGSSRALVLVDDGTLEPAGPPRVRWPGRSVRPLRPRPQAGSRDWLGSLFSLLLVIVLLGGAAWALRPADEQPRAGLREQALAMAARAENSVDVFEAHALAIQARDMAERATTASPIDNADLVPRLAISLDAIDRAIAVQPAMAVRFGPTGANVVDLAVADDRLYTLDVQETAVRAFDATAIEQLPTPKTLMLGKGTSIGGRQLDTPVAIQYLPATRSEGGVLTVVDRLRNVAQLRADGAFSASTLPSSLGWKQLGALAADDAGDLYVLDSGAGMLLEYARTKQRLADPPTPVLDARARPGLSFDRVAEVVPLQDVYLRLEDGTMQRVSRDGQPLTFSPRAPEGPLGPVVAIAADRAGGLYLADPLHSRIVQVAADGAFIRQLRDPALAGVRQIQTSPDGRRLFGLVAAGVLSFEVPAS